MVNKFVTNQGTLKVSEPIKLLFHQVIVAKTCKKNLIKINNVNEIKNMKLSYIK